jgi:uncharacterized protein YbjT (DUF2867 family)
MRLLVLGATGFIGSAAVARLLAAGHQVRVVTRPGTVRTGGVAPERVGIDIARATDPADWTRALDGIDAVLNCAGVFQDSPRDSTIGVHAAGPAALYRACMDLGVKRVVHLSAIGAAGEPLSDFSRSKATGERTLTETDLDWVILRPSVVLGRNAYGSGALFRGLAALPVLPVIPGAGLLQPVWIDDLTRTIERLLQPDAPTKIALEIVGPERLAMHEVVARYRGWLGFPPARQIRPPRWLFAPAYALGYFLGRLGWRPPIRGNARLEMARGAVGDPTAWTAITGSPPLSLGQALARDPAPVQEQWFARLYFLRPLLLAALSLYWVGTGIVSIGPGWERGLNYLAGTPLVGIAPAIVAAGALADMAVGVGIGFRRTCRAALLAGIAVTLFYAVAGTVIRPDLWFDPLGAMLKIAPILAATLVALAILGDR